MILLRKSIPAFCLLLTALILGGSPACTEPAKFKCIGKNPLGYMEYRNLKDGAVMILIPQGKFLMGSPAGDGENDEHPQHTIYLNSYFIYKYEVTNKMFEKFVKETGYIAKGDWKIFYEAGLENHPVVRVTWDDATAYCRWAGTRLPTEAEWEKAARGTEGRTYPWGNEWDKFKCSNKNLALRPQMAKIATEGDSSGQRKRGSLPVGSFPEGASPYGVMDMAGNVWEWCSDWYQGNYYQHSPPRNPRGPQNGPGHVLRGGSWRQVDESLLRTAYRSRIELRHRCVDLGFRCALTQ